MLTPHGTQRGRTRALRLPMLLAALLLLASSGCSHLRKQREQSEQEQNASLEQMFPDLGLETAETADETPIDVQAVVPPRAKDAEDQLVLADKGMDTETRKPVVGEYPDKLIKEIEDPEANIEVMLNFDAAPLTEIVPLFAELLNFSYLVDPSVKGAVTMTVDSEMTAREAWSMFEHILWLAGAYASRNPGFIHVMPFEKMAQERRLLVQHDPVANVEVAFLPIRYAQSSEIIGNLKPFLTDGATVTDLARLNTLLVVEAPANMAKIRALVERLDKKGEAGWPHVVLRCHQVDAEVVVEELQNLLPVLGFPVTDKGPSGGKIKLTTIQRLQVIVASAAVPDVLEEVKRWAEMLDQEDRAEQESIFFYNVRHSSVETLTEALNTFFPNTAATKSSRKAKTTKSTSSKAGSSSAPPTPSRTGSVDNVEVETIFDTPVIIYADPEQNRLAIRTTKRAYALVHAVLQRLDQPPLQVLIQAIVAQINLDKSTQFGFAYAAKEQYGDANITGIFNNLHNQDFGFEESDGDSTSTTSLNNLASGYAMLIKDGGLNEHLGFIKAVAGEGNTRVVSAPQIMASNDQEAKINVGKKVPLLTNDYTDVDDDSTYNRSYNYEDTGIIMTVTPHVTAGN